MIDLLSLRRGSIRSRSLEASVVVSIEVDRALVEWMLVMDTVG